MLADSKCSLVIVQHAVSTASHSALNASRKCWSILALLDEAKITERVFQSIGRTSVDKIGKGCVRLAHRHGYVDFALVANVANEYTL